jgi:arginyl-tRNA--protein-N-Asp/Glu arginylyltransferase
MARLVRHFIEEPRTCAYLFDRMASLEYRLMVNVSPEELEALLLRGWRRFGPAYFRPACRACGECISIRLDVRTFVASASQKRALKRSRRFRLELGRPKVDAERLELHRLWHATREADRGWEPSALTEEEYGTQFAFPSATGREVAWYDGPRLVGISLLDVTKQSVSAAYFFYHPDIARLSPGVGNVMRCVQLAKDTGARYVYLGYRVEGCASLVYKGQFRPHELLSTRPALTEPPVWTVSD